MIKNLCKCGCGRETTMILHTNSKKGLLKGNYYDYICGHHTRNKVKSQEQKEKMSISKKNWYKNNPDKAREKSDKSRITKILKGVHSGEKNSNFGSGIFRGKSNNICFWKTKDKELIELYRKEFSLINKNEKNPMWKADDVGYNALHNWIRKNKLKPELCENCNKAFPYDLANISGLYKRDINDFKWLCRSCHMKEDNRINNLKNQNINNLFKESIILKGGK